MYPIPEFVDFELSQGSYSFRDEGLDEEFSRKFNEGNFDEDKLVEEYKNLIFLKFKEFYRDKLNSCIDKRYRQEGFGINYFLFEDSNMSDTVLLQDSDNIKTVGLNYKTHVSELKYPDEDYILNQLGDVDILRIGGFHMWDCVERIAKRAHEKGIETLVDEDLTEFFTNRIKDNNFQEEKYPTYNPHKAPGFFESFMEARKNKPWLWQDY